MSWSYKKHLSANYGYADEKLSECPERVTRLTFDQWLTFYHGDPEHWTDFENCAYVRMTNRNSYHLPMYCKIDKTIKVQYTHKHKTEPIEETISHKTYIYIKFLTRSDFRKYHKYMKKLAIAGEDFENQREILELAQHIGKIADERLREAQERTQRAIDENEKLMKEARLRLSKELEGGQKYELSF